MKRPELSAGSSVNGRDQGLLLLAVLLPGLYIADILYGVSNAYLLDPVITPGKIARGMVLVISLCLAIFYRNFLPKPFAWLLVAMMVNIALGSFVSGLFPTNLAYDIVAATKVVYGPLVAALFYFIYLRFDTRTEQVFFYLEIAFYLLGISLLVMNVFSIGRDTYASYEFGWKGLYRSQNDISLSTGLVLCAALFQMYRRVNLARIILTAAGMAGLVGIGTRTGIIAPIAVSLSVSVAVIYTLLRAGRESGRARRALWVLPLMILMGASASYISYKMAASGDYQASKFERTVGGEFHRRHLLETGRLYVQNRSMLKDILGEGAYSFRLGVAQHLEEGLIRQFKSVEMDWFDLYGQYGIVFAVLMHLFYLFFLIQAMWLFLLYGRLEWGIVALMLGIFLSHSLIAGHAMVSPVISTLAAAIIGLLMARKNLESNAQQNSQRQDALNGCSKTSRRKP